LTARSIEKTFSSLVYYIPTVEREKNKKQKNNKEYDLVEMYDHIRVGK